MNSVSDGTELFCSEREDRWIREHVTRDLTQEAEREAAARRGLVFRAISNNGPQHHKRIGEMAGMSHTIRERTDALDAAGNTNAAIGKGFAIGSAALVSLALFGAFVSRAGIEIVNVLTPKVFIGLLIGAMLPCWFSAMTMKSVGSPALKMVEEVRRQFNTIPGLMEGTAKPDYATCVKISTDASLKEMIPPGALVMVTLLLLGPFLELNRLLVYLQVHLFQVSRLQYRLLTQAEHGIMPRSTLR